MKLCSLRLTPLHSSHMEMLPGYGYGTSGYNVVIQNSIKLINLIFNDNIYLSLAMFEY